MRTRATRNPCSQPSPIAAPTINNTAANPGTPHCLIAIDSSTPSSARTDPTDRSMPPVMITAPRPRPSNPNAPINRAVFCRFSGARNRGFIIAVMAHNTTRRIKMPSSFFILCESAPRAVASAVQSMDRLRGPRSLPSAVLMPHGQPHDRLFARFGAPQNAGQIPFVHHGYAVADA